MLQRYPGYATAPARQAAISAGWSSQPPQTAMSDGWFDREDDVAPPRPPANIYGDVGGEPSHAAPAPRVHEALANKVARADDASSPYVIMAPNRAPTAVTHAPALEKPKLKPQVKRKKPEPTPVAQPAAAPSVVTPARADAAGEPATAAPRVADTKAAPASAPEKAAVAPAAPTPNVSAPRPALNDVPVAPLE